MVALTRGNGVPVTPRSAQQGEVLPHCQRKEDGKQNCSEHVILVASRQQEQSPINRNAKVGKHWCFRQCQAPWCGISALLPKIPHPDFFLGAGQCGLQVADETSAGLHQMLRAQGGNALNRKRSSESDDLFLR